MQCGANRYSAYVEFFPQYISEHDVSASQSELYLKILLFSSNLTIIKFTTVKLNTQRYFEKFCLNIMSDETNLYEL